MKPAIAIPSRQGKEYASQGYFVVQNMAQAHVQVTDDGVHIKVGQTMALAEFDSSCEKAKEKGLIRLVATPIADSSKKEKKKSPEVQADQAPDVSAEIMHSEPANEEKVSAPAPDGPANAPSEVDELGKQSPEI